MRCEIFAIGVGEAIHIYQPPPFPFTSTQAFSKKGFVNNKLPVPIVYIT
jgi:hypothetical protein